MEVIGTGLAVLFAVSLICSFLVVMAGMSRASTRARATRKSFSDDTPSRRRHPSQVPNEDSAEWEGFRDGS